MFPVERSGEKNNRGGVIEVLLHLRAEERDRGISLGDDKQLTKEERGQGPQGYPSQKNEALSCWFLDVDE